MFSLAVGREELYKQISLACVESVRSVWATLGFPLLTAGMLSRFTLLRLQVALQGYCLKRALGSVHFPSLSRSGSGSWVLHKGADSVGPVFFAFPGRSISSDQVLGEHTLQVQCVLSPPRPQPLVSGRSRLQCAVCLFWRADL